MRLLGWVVAVLFSVLAGAPLGHAQTGLDFGRYVALVIGNNDYRHLPKLKTAVGDARAVADLLRSRYDFQVELLLNADRDAIIRAVNGYRAKLRDSDNLLIYYAGHGLIDEATDRGFWLPTDADKENEARWIDVAVISSNLRAMQARHILVIADSCYAGSLVRASEQAGIPSGGERTLLLQRMRDRRARVALTSGSLEPVIDSGGSGHSVFAGALLTLLRANAEIVSASELFARLRGRVVANAQQTPLYADIRFAGHEGGDFIFVPRGATLSASAQAPGTTSDAQAALELAFWNSIKDSAAPDDYQAYLEAFPSGRFAPLARRRVEVALAARPSIPVGPSPQPAAGVPPPTVAVAPVRPATPAATALPGLVEQTPPAVADAAALQQQWPKIAAAIRRQYDRVWARYEEAYQASSINSYRLKLLTADEISLSLDYMAHSTQGSYASGRPRLRTQDIRIRNRAPGFAILQWGPYRVDTSVTDASQIDIHWEVISERVIAQYDRELAVADGAVDMAGVDSYRLDRLDANEIALTIEYRVNSVADAATQSKPRNAEVRLRNKAPDFRIVKWGSLPISAVDHESAAPQARISIASVAETQQFWPILRRALERQYADSIRFRPAESLASTAESGPPSSMLIKRHAVTALQSEQLTVAITYEVAGASARGERDATVTLRNAGPAFEILEWRR